jgi:polyisoprenoid-binding protein YceI
VIRGAAASSGLEPGTHAYGPENATLSVRTGRAGAAAKAGHDLLIEVTAWSAAIDVGDRRAPERVELRADAASLRVREGTGGMQALGDEDKAGIEQTIASEVLDGCPIEFRSASVEPSGEPTRFAVVGELALAGRVGPLVVDLAVEGDGALRGTAVVRQSDWGIKPYSTLFGALKVADEVEIEIAATIDKETAAWP